MLWKKKISGQTGMVILIWDTFCVNSDPKPVNLGEPLGGPVVHRLQYPPDLGRKASVY